MGRGWLMEHECLALGVELRGVRGGGIYKNGSAQRESEANSDRYGIKL